ncbi:Gfo/Idh/MocA family oxidoreductase [Limibacter armeniacum]|uniref:Gfo/Idh/MocA family oxidoreductase n=1 Tax=Limibacter armeniacum TaxID=466084 RepID=UPI002FE6179B
MKRINVAIVGFGLGGKVFHAPILSSLEEFSITKIMTSNPQHTAFAQVHYPNAEVVTSYDSILEDQNIELVVIATPNHLHFSLASDALKHHKHVIVEKPFTVTTDEADQLIALAKQQERIITVNHNRRWDSDFLTIQKLVKSEVLGEIMEYEAHFDRFRNYVKEGAWKETTVSGSGILYDLGSHLIDQALSLFGLPKSVYADLRMQREHSPVVDNFEVILSYNDKKVTLKAGMLVRETGPRYSIYGREGTFIKSGMDVQEELLGKGKKPNDDANWGTEPIENWGTLNTTFKGLHFKGSIESEKGDYRKLYKNLAGAIRGTEEIAVSGEQARNVISIIELAYLSHQEQRVISFE